MQQDAIKRSHRCIKCCCKLLHVARCRRPTCCQVINLSLFWLLLHVCDYRQLLGRRVCVCVCVCATIAPGHGHGCGHGHGHGHGLLLSALPVVPCALSLDNCRKQNLRGSWRWRWRWRCQRLERLGHLKIAAAAAAGQWQWQGRSRGRAVVRGAGCGL